MAKKRSRAKLSAATKAGDHYESVLADMVVLLEAARRNSARTVNALMTATYWEMGRRIVEWSQAGEERAGYGDELLAQLAVDLSKRFGRGFSKANLEYMRRFYLGWQIPQTLSGELSPAKKAQTLAAQPPIATPTPARLNVFPLPWSHYVRLLALKTSDARQFYETEAIRGGWSVRQLERQINTQFYERTCLSRNKGSMLEKAQQTQPADLVTPDEEIKDPYVLEFLNLKDEYSESDLEGALIANLETFLMELGGDFAFVGRQRRLRIDDEWFRIDLLFFHRRLKSLVIIDLKLGKFSHADAGQMHLYLNYAREHWVVEGENPPIGLILCSSKGETLVKYALEGLANKILAAEYRTALPTEAVLAARLEQTLRRLEDKPAAPSKNTKKQKAKE